MRRIARELRMPDFGAAWTHRAGNPTARGAGAGDAPAAMLPSPAVRVGATGVTGAAAARAASPRPVRHSIPPPSARNGRTRP